MTTFQTFLCLVPFVLGCTRVAAEPTTVPDAGAQLHRVAPTETPAVPRTQNPDSQRVHEALTTILGFPVTVLTSHPIETSQAPYRDLVVFKTSGDLVCRARLPKERCLMTGGDIIPWHE